MLTHSLSLTHFFSLTRLTSLHPTPASVPFKYVFVSADGLSVPQLFLLPSDFEDALLIRQFNSVSDNNFMGAFDQPPECAGLPPASSKLSRVLPVWQ